VITIIPTPKPEEFVELSEFSTEAQYNQSSILTNEELL
jgi:hypothetical protein